MKSHTSIEYVGSEGWYHLKGNAKKNFIKDIKSILGLWKDICFIDIHKLWNTIVNLKLTGLQIPNLTF